jgi:acid phosphatase type 7
MRTRSSLVLAAALLFVSATCSFFAQSEGRETALEDDALTSSLINAPGPTFRLSNKELPKHSTLIAYGDQRFTDPANSEVTNPKVRRLLVEQVAKEHPDVLLLSGDVPYNGAVRNDYDVYRSETATWREQKLRVFPAMGNHELHGAEVREPTNWWNAFPELKNRRWYSVEFANAYIITLDSNLSLDESTKQRKWLDDQLDHLPKSTGFVFVSLHHPPVADPIKDNPSHNVRPNERQLAVLLEKRSANANVMFIVIAGHIHNYQRFFENGVVYLVSGGGGAKPYPIARTAADLFQDAAFPNYHYVEFRYDGKDLQGSMYRLHDPESAAPEWEVKDTFVVSLRKQKARARIPTVLSP